MSQTTFSALDRSQYLTDLQATTYDLLIIGGGITGAGAALDAASRGLKTALVEKVDFGWGTSSRSTKLIHGGLRYLKQLEIGLVREVGRERAVVHRIAPHIVIPEKMLLPIVEGGSLGKTMSALGLWVYDYLAGVEKDERRQMLSKDETADAEPMLRKDILKGGGLYYEYRTDDARLTIENVKTAVQYGATCLNYVEVTGYTYDADDQVTGVTACDTRTGNTLTIKAKKVVNATGPWVDKLRAKDLEAVKGKRLHLTKGVHLVVPHRKLPIKQAVYFDVLKDGRMVFAIPRGRITYIGTTDTHYQATIDAPHTTAADVAYVLAATNDMFPGVDLAPEDVISTWAGLRPLIHEDGKSPSELSRKDEVFHSKTGLISIAGGKLTGYRKMAERIVDVVVKALASTGDYGHLKPCQTATLSLIGGRFESQKAVEQFMIQRIGEARQIEAHPEQVIDLVRKYGTATDMIIEKAFELYPTTSDPVMRLHRAELWYAVHHEMTNNLNDYLIRRSGRLYFERDLLADLYPQLAAYLADLLGWDEATKLRDMSAFKAEYEAVVQFKNEISQTV